jgi:hypothetical protein
LAAQALSKSIFFTPVSVALCAITCTRVRDQNEKKRKEKKRVTD